MRAGSVCCCRSGNYFDFMSNTLEHMIIVCAAAPLRHFLPFFVELESQCYVVVYRMILIVGVPVD